MNPTTPIEPHVTAATGSNHGHAADRPSKPGGLTWATAYLLAVLTTAVTLAAHLLLRLHGADVGAGQWATFALLATAAAAAQFFVVITPRNQSYHTTIVFLVPAALLLPPEFLPLVALIQHLPEWLKKRYALYIQGFNIANYTLDLLAAWASAQAVLHATWLIPSDRPRSAAAWLVAAVVLVGANHVLLALMLRLGRGHSWRTSGLFTYESLSTDLGLAVLGITITVIWHANPWLVGLALAPLLLIQRSLAVPALEEEARVDPKTGLFNARHFAAALTDELDRARRFDRPLSLLMVDLDLLRAINNSYGHLAGDAVLQGIAAIFRRELRHYDVPARFGGEEFSILLPETPRETALEIAERIRRSVAESGFEVETSTEPIRATISIGVATSPADGSTPNELIHQADVAVYRAKLQGRNRVLGASAESLLLPEERRERLVTLPSENEHRAPIERATQKKPKEERRQRPARQHGTHGPLLVPLSIPLAALVSLVGAVGIASGAAGLLFGHNRDLIGMLAITALVGAGQALALEVPDGSISVGAVGALAGVALFGPRIALALAVTATIVDWSTRRSPFHRLVFNIGTLSIATLGAAGIVALCRSTGVGIVVAVVAAGLGYFAANTGLLSIALALEGKERWSTVWQERFTWLLPHYLSYGLIGGVIALGYEAVGPYALLVFVIPLLLIRKTQEAYVAHTRRSVQKLREAAETIQGQNVSLERANQLLRERSMAAMESLAATVDARDAYTAGHSRRVQRHALALGRQLDLSRAELDVLGYAALFHDIGKLAIPDAILLKPGALSDDEWKRMQEHAEEGARIIERLGFLHDSVPAIQHHHERWDGRSGYPVGLAGDEIPLGARIIHVVDALDSMLTSRLYRAARPLDEAMLEIRTGAGAQFCHRCVEALERVLAAERAETRDAEPTPNAAELTREAMARLQAPTRAQTAASAS
jgi:diguanylate cyclase (GGDEF)-like protein/putative nucleotidyltransferase with HDIG domain